MRFLRGAWCGALAVALAACGSKGGSGAGSGSATGASGTAGGTPATPPPKVALLRCAPARPLLAPPHAAGILGSTSAQSGAVFASLTGTGDISSGLDDKDIQGGLVGNDPGDANGGFGFGRSGFGPGGGAPGGGTIGTGKYGTISHGSGTGYGIGGGRGGMHGRTAAVPAVRIGQPSAVGDLDKAIIRRYVKRNISKIQYCYERELLAKPGLHGTVTTQFFISPSGDVPSATAAGVDPAVSSCVAEVLRGIEFPKPKGGGGVQVNYPFAFDPGDANNAVATATPSAAPSPTPSAPIADVDAGAPAAPPAPAPSAWTPYGLAARTADVAQAAATADVQAQVQQRLGELDTCFGTLAGGSLRAMIGAAPDTPATVVRVGGLGKADVEGCVADRLRSIKIAVAADASVEIACDLSRGPEQPWRVSPDAYDAIEVSRTTIKHGADSWSIDDAGHAGLDGMRDALVIAAPDATGAAVRAASALASDRRATVLAVRDSAGGPPRYLATAPVLFAYPADGDAPLQIVVHADAVELCGASLAHPARASIKTAADLDAAFREVAAACAATHCSDAAVIDPHEAPDVASVVTLVDRARVAGFTRVAIGYDLSCAP